MISNETESAERLLWSAPIVPATSYNDPDLSSQWHLAAVNVAAVWDEFRGRGIVVGVLDDGVQYTHPDLAANYDTTLDFDARGEVPKPGPNAFDWEVPDDDAYTTAPGDRHGTAVAGVIAAALDNAAGGAGIAPGATLVGYRMGFDDNGSVLQVADLYDRLASLDVANNSWNFGGFLQDSFSDPFFAPIAADLDNALATGRDGLGTVVVFAAGNGGSGQDTNYHNLQNDRGIITVAATDNSGAVAVFSTPGASILVSAPGVGVYTTDRVGGPGYDAGDYASLNGTSFSAPIVSGVAALMLEANPNLGWRDVQEILAFTAIQTGGPGGWSFNHASGWNGGAMHVNHNYGFGLVDAMAAVRLAESWRDVSTSANEVFVSNVQLADLAMPDFGALQSTLMLPAGLRVDHVEIDLDISHANIAELSVLLTSPTGTQSLLFHYPSPPTAIADIFFTFSTTQDWGELSGGTWTLTINDAVAGNAGTLEGWAIRAYGDPEGDDIYVYTDEFSSLAAADSARRVLSDAGGIDAINTAAIAAGTTLDLRPGNPSTIDGQPVTISAVLENADTGDGNDYIIGNDADNWLRSWRGDDAMDGGMGADTLDGGVGSDLYLLGEGGGLDTIVDAAGDLDAIRFGFGIAPEEVVAGRSGTDLVLAHGSDVVTVQDWFAAGADKVEQIEFTDSAEVWDAAELTTLSAAHVNLVTGDDGANTLQGSAVSDLIYGFDPDGPQGTVTSIPATRVASGLNQPLYAVSPQDDMERLFIVEKGGQIKILDLATQLVLPTAFLDVSAQIATAGEQGLLGLAFHPDFADNGYFYVNLVNTSGDTEIRRYQVSAGNPNVADAASATLIITIDQPGFSNHKGGWLDFGRDGYLYAALGDGGGGDDPFNNAQNMNSLLGKMLRLDVNADGFPGDATRNYAIPADNPFVGVSGADEIWALGLRNPWRNSFDRGLGDFYIADVGQETWEEIDLGQAGANYAWDVREGPAGTNSGTPPAPVPFTEPIYFYQQNPGGQSITGGYVYRGPSEGLHGQYFFADFISGRIYTLRRDGTAWVAEERTGQITADAGTVGLPASFAQDGSGNLYIVDLGGEVFRLTPNVTSADQGDQLSGLSGNDMLFGGSGDDVLDGGSGDDELQGGIGADTLDGGTGGDKLVGGPGNDTYFVDDADDLVAELSGAGVDAVHSSITYALGPQLENLTLTGSAAINGTGNALANILNGNTAANTLTGGAGNDTLAGGTGNDRYLFDIGFGQDLVIDSDASAGNQDVIRFGAGIAPGSVSVTSSGMNLVLARGGESVTVQNWFASNADKIERVEFADSPVVWDVATLMGMSEPNDPPVAVNDAIAVNENATTANLAGLVLANDSDPDEGDTLRVLAVNTAGTAGTVAFNSVAQTLTYTANAAAHEALALGATASDSFSYTVGDNANATAVANVTVTVTGVNDAPTLAAALVDQSAAVQSAFSYAVPANAFADADVGDMLTYTATRSDGTALPAWLVFDPGTRSFGGTPGSSDVGVVSVRVTATDTQGAAAFDDFVVTVAGSGSVITGTPGDDTLNGTAGPDLMSGLAGKDILFGNGGDDTLVITGVSGSPWDLVNGGEGHDRVVGAEDADTFRFFLFAGDYTVEEIDGGGGENVIAAYAGYDSTLDFSGTQLVNIARIEGDTGNDTITGSAGADVIAGGAGNDQLFGGGGGDTFVITGVSGSAWDVVSGGAGLDRLVGSAGADTFRFFLFAGDYTVEEIDGGGGENVIAAYVGYNSTLDFSGTQLVNIARIEGNTGNDTITGSTGADVIVGGAGNDMLNGGGGNDTETGGGGNDLYLFNGAFGQDTVVDTDATPGNQDIVRFGAGITPGSVAVSRSGMNLVLTRSSDSVTVQNWFAADADKIERVEFTGNPTVWNVATLTAMAGPGGNQSPVIGGAVPAQTVNDNATISPFTALTISDADAGETDLVVTVTLDAAAKGAFTASSLAASGFAAQGGGAYSRSGLTPAAAEAAIRQLVFDPADNRVAPGATETTIFAVTVSDGEALASNNATTVVATSVNDAPVLANAIADQAATEDAAFGFQVPAGTFADADANDTLTYNATLAGGSALPSWLTFDPATRTFSGTPLNANVGTVSVELTATDSQSAFASDTFTIAVANTNDAPVLANAIADQGATEDSAFSFLVPAATFTDVDANDTLVWSAALAGGGALPSWLTFDAGSRTFSGTPLNANVGPVNVAVTATDSQGAFASDTFTITVANTNDAPVLTNAIADQEATEDSAFSFVVPAATFTDVDANDTLVWSAALTGGGALPSWLSFDAGSRTFSGTPVNASVGPVNVEVSATDSQSAFTSDTFTITVANVNDAPVATNDSSSVPEDLQLTMVRAVLVDNDFDVDPTSDTLTIVSVQDAQHGAVELNEFQVTTFTPEQNYHGPASFTYTVSDGNGGLSTATVSITVTPVNDAPTVGTTIAHQSAVESAAFSFEVPLGAFADIDAGDQLFYSFDLADGSPLPDWLLFDGLRTISGTPDGGDVGAIEIRVTATDLDESVSQDFTLTVGGNSPPEIGGAVANQSVLDNETLAPFSTLTITDPDAGETDMTATVVVVETADGLFTPGSLATSGFAEIAAGVYRHGAATAAELQAAIRLLVFDPTDNRVAPGQTEGTFFVVGVNDGSALAGDNGTSVVTTSVNDAPVVAVALVDQAATVGVGFGYTVPAGSFADVDLGDSLTYTATRSDGTALPAWLVFDPVNRSFSGTPGTGDAGTLAVRVRVDDAHTGSVFDDFVVTVAGSGSVITGTPGDDTLNGTAGPDLMSGLAGKDILFGNGGDDTLVITGVSGSPWDLVNGGEGHDRVVGAEDADTFRFFLFAGDYTVEEIDGGGGENVIAAYAGYDSTLDFGSTQLVNIARIEGDTGNDTITGSAGADVIAGGAGNDQLFGGGGGDTFVITGVSGSAWDVVSGGAGLDRLVGSAGADTFRFFLFAGDYTVEEIDGGGGENVIAAYVGYNSTLDFSGTQLVNIARIEGNTGNDTITGSTGADVIVGGAGNDIMAGGAGDDTYGVDSIFDAVTENPGRGADTVAASVSYALPANVESLNLEGLAAINGTGNALANALNGNAGANELDGRAGADMLYGGSGDDIFAFRAGEAQGDTVLDFAGNGAAAGDSLRFTGFGAGATLTQNGATDYWTINYGSNAETIQLVGVTTLNPADYTIS